MCSSLRDPVLGDDDDLVRVADRGKSVCDRDGSPVFGQFLQALLDPAFAFIVQGTGCLVQDQDWRILQEHPCDGDTLLLTAGQTGAPLANIGVVSVRKLPDEVMDIGAFRGRDDLIHGSSGPAVGDVIADCP